MKKYFFSFIFTLSAFFCFAAETLDIGIAKYKDDKACAISYTFDDGLKEHYTLVFPYFEDLGFKGTFWINGVSINEDENSIKDTTRMTWGNLKEMADHGHEISNHGWAHKNFGRHGLDEIKEDVLKNDSAIYKHIGIMPLTFCYPNNTKTREGVEFVSKNRVGTRTEQRAIGSRSNPEELEKWVSTLIETNDWGVGMTHGMTYGYDAFRNPQIFWDHLSKVKAQENDIWVATFQDVAAYTKEQENTVLNVTKKKNKWVVTPVLSLDKNIFTAPLTAVVVKQGEKRITVKQNKKKLAVKIQNDKFMFDFDPFGGEIEISLK